MMNDAVRPWTMLVLGAALALAGGLGASQAQTVMPRTPLDKRVLVRAQPVKTCPDMALGFGLDMADGGRLQGPQGWFFEAAVQERQNGQTVVVCRYGRRKLESLRASSYAYDVEYVITGYTAAQCAVAGATVSCTK